MRDARDLMKAYEEVLNAGLRLLPLYNPFTFFLNSLRLVPKPYLRVMYGDRIFDGSVRALMEKYGVRVSLRIAPGLGKELDEELGVLGHEKDSVGDLVIRSIAMLFNIIGEDEFKKYLDKYGIYKMLYEEIGIHSVDYLYYKWLEVEIKEGTVMLTYFTGQTSRSRMRHSKTMSYFEFLERFSPVMFLGLAKYTGSNTLNLCLASSCLSW